MNIDGRNLTRPYSWMKSYRQLMTAKRGRLGLLQKWAPWQVIQSQEVSPKHISVQAALIGHAFTYMQNKNFEGEDTG